MNDYPNLSYFGIYVKNSDRLNKIELTLAFSDHDVVE